MEQKSTDLASGWKKGGKPGNCGGNRPPANIYKHTATQEKYKI